MSQVWQERSQSCKVQEHQGKWSKEIRRTESEQGQIASPNLTQERGPSVEDDAENHELEEEATATDMSALALASKWQMIDRHVVAWRRFQLGYWRLSHRMPGESSRRDFKGTWWSQCQTCSWKYRGGPWREKKVSGR